MMKHSEHIAPPLGFADLSAVQRARRRHESPGYWFVVELLVEKKTGLPEWPAPRSVPMALCVGAEMLAAG